MQASLKHLFLLALVLGAAALQADIGKAWKAAHKGNFSSMSVGVFEASFPKIYQAPGPPPTVEGETPEIIKVTPEEFERCKEDAVRTAKELKEAEAKVQKLKEEYDEESLEYAEQRLKQAQGRSREAQKKLEAATRYVESLKEKKAAKAAKAVVTETHPEEFAKFFHLKNVLEKAGYNLNKMDVLDNSSLTNVFPYPDASFKLYIVTDKALYKKLKGRDPMITPAKNIYVGGREILAYLDHTMTNFFLEALSYSVCDLAFREMLETLGNEGPGDVVRIGYCGLISQLDATMTLDKNCKLERLDESKLFSVSHMIDPGSMKDQEQCLYYLRQAKAFTKPLMTDNAQFKRFVWNARGGNSGMRANFDNIKLSRTWGDGYDTFLAKLNEECFLPLTQ